MKILLIDDHTSFCEGLQSALKTMKPEYEVEFESDAELIPTAILEKKDYDLIITDLMMPGLGGIELIRYLHKHNQTTPIMVMSSVEDLPVIHEVFSLGAVGYLPKSYSVHEVIEAIENCRQGKVHLPKSLDLSDYRESLANGRESGAAGVELTRRQLEILSLMDKGLNNREISEKLFISRATVKTHINHIYKHFGVDNRVSCLKAARKSGF